MATSDFLVVAPGPAPNIASQATYAADPIVTTGNVSGVAKSAIINKALRQGTVMAAVLAQFIADKTGANSVDDGTTPTLLANLKTASAQGTLLKTTTFVTAATWTPQIGTKYIEIEAAGGGGGGGGTPANGSTVASVGAGGAGGSYILAGYTYTSGTPLSVGIGSAGAGGAGTGGGTGGATSLGTLFSCPGGGGGQSVQLTTATAAGSSTQGAPGGTPTVTGALWSIVSRGQPGPYGLLLAGTPISGQGAPSRFGGGGPNGSNGNGAVGAAPGAGGSGAGGPASAAQFVGGAGAGGILIIKEYG